MANSTLSPSPEALRSSWHALLERQPRLRIRNAAAELGVSEAQLLATRVGDGVRRIDADLKHILPRLEGLGELMALTRNDPFVHEKTGVYRNVEVGGHVAQVVDHDIDLRIFPGQWRLGFAVESETRRGTRRSLQFFDPHGEAVHKVFLTDESDVDAWERLVAEALSDDQSPGVGVRPRPAPPQLPEDEAVDVAALEEEWRAMRDTHDFFGLLRRHGVGRTQAFRLVDDEMARPTTPGAARVVLESAASDGVELMVFVRSPGTFQIHHGPVHRIVDTPPWLNVLDPGFDLHVREAGIGDAWVVRKPTEAGWVTSVELFDTAGELAALFFGCRSEGQVENAAWRELALGLEHRA
jgi:putative hemin transport protein